MKSKKEIKDSHREVKFKTGAFQIRNIINNHKPNYKNAMKTFFCSFALLLFSFCAKAQESNPFTTGFEKSTPSKILGEQRKVWIHIPNSHGGNERYPVIYLLDGDENFNNIVSITEFMSNAGLCPPMIVVGILPVA